MKKQSGMPFVEGLPIGEAAAQTLMIDPTLTLPEQPADAKATGDAIAQIVPGLSETAKTALLNCFAHVAWIDEHGQDYYDALHDALYPATGLVSISAVFTQGSAVINEGEELNTLKQYLVVTGYYGDGVCTVKLPAGEQLETVEVN